MENPKRLFTVFSGQHPVAPVGQRDAQDFENARFIIHKEQLLFHQAS